MMRPSRYRAAMDVLISSTAVVVRGTDILRTVAATAAASSSSISVYPRLRAAAGCTSAAPVAHMTGAAGRLLLRGRLGFTDGHQRLELQEALLADALDVHQ